MPFLLPTLRTGLTAACLAAALATAPARAAAPAATPAVTPVAAAALVGPIAEYKAYVTRQVDDLVADTRRFADAVKAGDLPAAQRLYAPTRQHYERVEPVAELFGELDSAMDARADDFEHKEEDAGWTGFHRLEKGLFADKSTAGLAPIADRLVADTAQLQERLRTLVIKPKDMVGGAAALIEEVASKKISGEEDRYSGTDLWDFRANVDGAQQIVALLRPLLRPRAPQLLAAIDRNFAQVDAVLGRYRQAEGFKPYGSLSTGDRNALKGAVTELAEDLSKLRGTLGVD